MGEVLTLAEMKAKYDNEWLLVGDPELDENLEIVRGRVLFHSRDREEVDRADMELRPKSAAHVYTGKIPEDAVFLL